ncbi:MAG: ABC transporter substrate-binding protein [Streptosporangiaceae bacterium]
MRRPSKLMGLSLVAGSTVLLAACGGGATSGTGTGSGKAAGRSRQGGTVTFLTNGLGSTWSRGLDAASAGVAATNYLSAIYGQLFQLGPGGEVNPDLATGDTFSDHGRTVTITLRRDVKFQDGTPFNADAVAWNFRRDLKTPCSCSPSGSWPPLSSRGITAPDDHTVVLHFKRPYAAFIPSLMASSANHIASPTAVKKLGEKKFRQRPVGAGPFEVVSDVVSSKLELKRYSGYWKEGHPYLDKLTFKSIGGDQAAYQAILAGQAQATALSTPSLIRQADQNGRLTVSPPKATSVYVIQLNTAVPPFDDKRARAAIYYATNAKTITTHLFHGVYPVTQSFTGPGGLFSMPEVPGYRTHDLAKAKRLVRQLGGLEVDLFGDQGLISRQTTQALQSQWAKAGIKTTIHAYALPRQIQVFKSEWQAAFQPFGGRDPAIGTGLPFRFTSDAPYTGIHDKKLDRMVRQAATTLDKRQRAKLYARIAKYMSDQAYAPFLFAYAPASVSAKGVHGPGITVKTPASVGGASISWDDAWIAEDAR